MKPFEEKFKAVLANRPDNYLLPFIWVHNEDDNLIIREIEKIHESGIQSLCVESRTHEEFGHSDWWSDIELIFNECEKHGMKVWLLDDKHFPTGFANGMAIAPENMHLAKRQLTELHTDVIGPVKNAALIIDTLLPESAIVKKIVAYKRKDTELDMYDEYIDFTDEYKDGLVWVDLPCGIWKVFTVYECLARPDNHIDTMNPEAVDILINAVYEPMYQHFGKYFGNTFCGFFSDEPYIQHLASSIPKNGGYSFNGCVPYNSYLGDMLAQTWGEDAFLRVPALFYNIDGVSQNFRVHYMDAASKLYSEHFCWKLGNWSREHNVEYIGHIIEDNERDTTFSSGAHFFRSLDGQDMAGIDVVLTEIAPGFCDVDPTISHGIHISDSEFFHYELAKLASSHSHIQPLKKGRAMCEMYGAYGWAAGLKTMKWLSDHMLVRGINYFVPHAFSGKSPDADCPPHFYEGGTNPQYKDFKTLMEYSNRMSTLLTDGVHKCKVAIYYRAESEWSGGETGAEKVAAKLLTDNQIDFDIIPKDYLCSAGIEDGTFVLGQESYPCLVVPHSEYAPIEALRKMKELAESGVRVVFAGGITEKSCEGESVSFLYGENIAEVSYAELAAYLRNEGFYDIRLSKPHKNLRYYRYIHNDAELYMFVNEDVNNECDTVLNLEGFSGGNYIEYNAMDNIACIKHTPGGIPIKLAPYNSVVIILSGKSYGLPEHKAYSEIKCETLEDCYDISLAYGAENYIFAPYKKASKLFNITSPEGITDFGGHIKYEAVFNTEPEDKTVLSIENAGETVNVFVNGYFAGVRIIPPYNFDITKLVKNGENKLEIIVTTHLGYKVRDKFSRYLVLEPSGITGSVKIKNFKFK